MAKNDDVATAFIAGAIIGAVAAGPEGAIIAGLIAASLEAQRKRR